MKKLKYFFALALFSVFGANADDVTIQGVPVKGELAESARSLMQANVVSNDAQSFRFSDIKFWVGEGENEAALVLQWNVDGEETALVWGYRFDDSATTGYTMLENIVKADDRLYMVVQNSAFGMTVQGIGYDADGDGEIALLNETGKEQQLGETRILIANGTFTAKDADDFFKCGFTTDGYWAYFVEDSETLPPAGYASTGASSRKLTDGCVDGWSYSNGSFEWKPLQAAEEPKPLIKYPEEYSNGFFIINEDWFGHRNGSVNWVASDGTVYYDVEAVANGLDVGDSETVLGSTTQFGQIYGDSFFISSKQGTRFVVLDAKTLEQKASFDVTGAGDGRDICAVSTDKVYVGGSNGIIIYNTADDTFGNHIEGLSGNQIGMIVRVGKYVFAVEQKVGIRVVDPEHDKVITTIENSSVQGLTVTKDGYIWCTLPSSKSLLRINPISLETEIISIDTQIVSTWGAYRPDYVCSSYAENALFVAGGSSFSPKSINKFNIDDKGNLTKDETFNFSIPEEYSSMFFYGSPRVNPTTGDLIITGTMSYSGPFELLYINPQTGEIKKITELASSDGSTRYWFPSVPVMSDDAAPVINLDDVSFDSDESLVIPVTEFVSDADNLAVLSVIEASVDDTDIASVTYDGLKLTVTPLSLGNTTLNLTVNSNGKVAEKAVPVTVSMPASVEKKYSDNINAYVKDNVLRIEGAQCGIAVIYDISGMVEASFDLSENTIYNLDGLQQGAYIVKIETENSIITKKIVK